MGNKGSGPKTPRGKEPPPSAVPLTKTNSTVRSPVARPESTYNATPGTNNIISRDEQIEEIDDNILRGLTAGVVDLTDNEIAEIPETICTANIVKLVLNNNRIRNIADEIGQCNQMQELWLENNKLFLMPMPKTMGNMRSLHTLVLKGNQLEEIPDEIASCPALTTVDLSENIFKSIPPAMLGLATLKTLRMNNNNIQAVPRTIAKLKNLTTLDLSHNKFSRLPEEIGQMTWLVELNVSFNGIRQLPASLCELGFVVSDNPSLQTLPTFDHFPKLRKLHIANLAIKELHPSIGGLEFLDDFEMRNNSQVSEIPPEIGKLKSLKRLDMYGCRFHELPLEIGNLTMLETFDLRCNSLTVDTFPNTFTGLVKLERLFLSENALSAVPNEIFALANLVYLDVGANKLWSIPDAIGKLSKLQHLSFRGNAIKRFPLTLANLSNLETLDMKHNEVVQIPGEFSQLKKLRKFDISNNMLTTVPWEFGELELTLKLMDVSSNPLVLPPRPIVDRGTAGMLRWLQQNRGRGEVRGLQYKENAPQKKK